MAGADAPTNKSTIYRFASIGVRGLNGERIKLERVKLPSGSFTSRQAVTRFILALNGLPVGDATVRPTTIQPEQLDQQQ